MALQGWVRAGCWGLSVDFLFLAETCPEQEEPLGDFRQSRISPGGFSVTPPRHAEGPGELLGELLGQPHGLSEGSSLLRKTM